MTKKALFILLIASVALPAFGQSQLQFKRISVDEGLSQGQVNFMLKDSKGFIWIGTQDGLNRYDGYTFKHYYHQPGDSSSLNNNYIWCLLEDSNKDIWVGTFGGELCRYNRETDSFQSFSFEPFIQSGTAGNSVRSLLEHPKGTLWIGADIGLWRLDIPSMELRKIEVAVPHSKMKSPNSTELVNIVALSPFSKDEILVGAGQGLFRVNTINEKNDPINFDGELLPASTSVVPTIKGGIWVGTHNGLFYLKRNELSGEVDVSREGIFEAEASTQFINNLFLDSQHTLWIGTNEGIFRLKNQNLNHYAHDSGDPSSISNDMVFHLLEIEPGLMWSGTREGVNAFGNNTPPFFNLNTKNSDGKLCSDAALGMLEDRNDNFWICTRQGLTRIEQFSKGHENWKIECMTPTNTPSMPYDYTIKLEEDRNGELWACFRRNGFAKLKKEDSGKWVFEKAKVIDKVLNSAGLNDMHFESDGDIWLGTPGVGLAKWQQETNNYELFVADSLPNSLRHSYIFCLMEDSQGRFWVGTANGGLCEMDKETGTFDCHVFNDLDPNSISSNMVLSIMEDSQRRVWVCTANGLNLLQVDGQFRRFYQKDGLPNNVVYGLLEDENGSLWASTNRGISKFTSVDSVFTTQNFSVADGLPGDEFNQHSFQKTKSGKLAFGGTNGVSIFDPNDIQPYPYPPEVALTGFQLFNQSLQAGKNSILKKEINEATRIRLRHDQNFIAFEFAALGYTQPENNQYAYMMEGLDEDWVYSGKRRFASYPNLQPGSYIFKIKASNHDGIWNEAPKTIAIDVLYPWWQTWWAYGAYLLITTLFIWGVIRFREQSVREIEHAKAAEREQFRKRTARDFHDEAGNKITKISLLTEVSKRQASGNVSLSKLLEQMEVNIQELRSGMRDFIWVLDPENDNLYDTLLRLKDFANDLFEHSPTHFRTEGMEENLSQKILNGNERRHLLLIFKEAMNNCAKYAEASEAILLIKMEADQLSISFKDNGKGFDPTSVKGNGLRNMKERAKKIGGEIFIVSENRTEVRVTF